MHTPKVQVLYTAGNLIDAIQNEPCIWNTEMNESGEDKEIALCWIATLFGLTSGSYYHCVGY